MNTPTTPNPFVKGAKVIHVRYGRFGGEPSYHSATISTVWKNGVFFLEGDHSQKRWSAGYRDGEWFADTRHYNEGKLYTADNDAVIHQIAEARAKREAANKLNTLKTRLSNRRSEWPLSPEQLAAIEAALAVFPE